MYMYIHIKYANIQCPIYTYVYVQMQMQCSRDTSCRFIWIHGCDMSEMLGTNKGCLPGKIPCPDIMVI